MLVKDLMTTDVITVKPTTPVSEVAALLQRHGFSGLPVVNDQNHVVGMVSERDFFTSGTGLHLPTYIKLVAGMDYIQGAHKTLPYVAEQIVRTKASDIMNQHIFFAKPENTMEEVAELLSIKDNNPVAVTDKENKLLGIVSRSDLLKPLVKNPPTAEIKKSIASRPIDNQVQYVVKDFSSRFAYVAKARANIWLTTAIVLFIVGFLAGIIYVVDPNIFGNDRQDQFYN
jgi:CBS domain-containing protein